MVDCLQIYFSIATPFTAWIKMGKSDWVRALALFQKEKNE